MSFRTIVLSLLILTVSVSRAKNPTEATQTDCLHCGIDSTVASVDKLLQIAMKADGQKSVTSTYIDPNDIFTSFSYVNKPVSEVQCEKFKTRIEDLYNSSFKKSIPYHQTGNKTASSGIYDNHLRPYQNVIESLVMQHGKNSVDCLNQIKAEFLDLAKKNEYITEFGSYKRTRDLVDDKKFEIEILTYSGLENRDLVKLYVLIEMINMELSAKVDSPPNKLDYSINGNPIYLPFKTFPIYKIPIVFDDIRLAFLPPNTFFKYPVKHLITKSKDGVSTSTEITAFKQKWLSEEAESCQYIAEKKLPAYSCKADLSRTIWITDQTKP